MPILGVVATHPSPRDLELAVRSIPEVVAVGDPTPNRLPIVLHTPDRRADEGVLDALRSLPGVLAVDLAFADFSDLLPPSSHPGCS